MPEHGENIVVEEDHDSRIFRVDHGFPPKPGPIFQQTLSNAIQGIHRNIVVILKRHFLVEFSPLDRLDSGQRIHAESLFA